MSFDEMDSLLDDGDDPAGAAPAERPEVLVVDDDTHVLRSVQTVLSFYYDVTLAASAQEALHVIRSSHAAVILDIRMPIHDGFWACDRIRERFPDIPVIFHTAHQSEKKREAVEAEHRPFAYLYKDGDVDRLLSTVAAAVTVSRPTKDADQRS